MVVPASVDELFRQKSLHEIHGVLRETRSQVETQKQEVRELVGNHYRSVLESSDHIQAMSACAAKISAGANRIEDLIASMHELATNVPASPSPGGRMFASASRAAEETRGQNREYEMGTRIIALLEVPETVRAHLCSHKFVAAAKTALIDAPVLQMEVEELLSLRGSGGSSANQPDFDFTDLVRQQASASCRLPRQIAASCLDAFGAVDLEPLSAAESFAIHLLLNSRARPASLLQCFLKRRAEVLRSLLDCSSISSGGNAGAGMPCSARLSAAAMVFEGTLILGAKLSSTTYEGDSIMQKALTEVLEGAERATSLKLNESHLTRNSSLRPRTEQVAAMLRQTTSGAASLSAELSRLGKGFLHEWAADDSDSNGDDGGRAQNLLMRLRRIIATAPAGELGTCERLGGLLRACTEKITNYRILLLSSHEELDSAWRGACRLFCPARTHLSDALSILTAAIELASAEVVAEHVGALQLELVTDDGGDDLATGPTASGGGTDFGVMTHCKFDARRREDMLEMRRQSRLQVLQFDEQLGVVVSDLNHFEKAGGSTMRPAAALLRALHDNLADACRGVSLPQADGASVEPPAIRHSLQRRAAQAAIAFDVLLSVASQESGDDETKQSQLHRFLHTAVSSGNPELVAQAQETLEIVKKCCGEAYCVWARLAVAPEENSSTLEAFWKLSDDEVPHACGWGSAKFAQSTTGDQRPGSQNSTLRAVPVPAQASPFIFERLMLAAQQALEVSSGVGGMPEALVSALKIALSEVFAAAYEAAALNLEGLKRSGMHHLLQLLFDLNFLRITLSTSSSAAAAVHGASRQERRGDAAYEVLKSVLARAESMAMSDPVDRLLYQEVLTASVKSHVQSVKLLLAPFYLHNPLYSFLFQSQCTAAGGSTPKAGVGSRNEPEGFELQATFVPPLRAAAPRFALLPVANASVLAHTPAMDFDARFGFESADRAAARVAASTAAAGSGTGAVSVSNVMQQVGSGLSGLGLGKARDWASLWGGGGPGTGMVRPPQAV